MERLQVILDEDIVLSLRLGVQPVAVDVGKGEVERMCSQREESGEEAREVLEGVRRRERLPARLRDVQESTLGRDVEQAGEHLVHAQKI